MGLNCETQQSQTDRAGRNYLQGCTLGLAFPDLSRRQATSQLLLSTKLHLQTPVGRLLGREMFDQAVKVGTSMCLQQFKACKVSQRATWSSSGHLPMKSHDNLTVLLEESDSCGSLPHASQA